MKTWQKLIFILALIVFVGVSVTISLMSISRPPYAFDEKTEIGGDETLNGWVLTGFNGNIGTKTLTIPSIDLPLVPLVPALTASFSTFSKSTKDHRFVAGGLWF